MLRRLSCTLQLWIRGSSFWGCDCVLASILWHLCSPTLSGVSSDRVGVMGSERLLAPGVACCCNTHSCVHLFSSCLQASLGTVSVAVGGGPPFAALVLGAVYIGVDGHFSVLRGTIYSEPVCHGRRYVSCFRYFGRLVFGLSPAFNGADHFSLPVFVGCAIIRPVEAPAHR